jgi:hypothetical protein
MMNIKERYLSYRLTNPLHSFSRTDIKEIEKAFNTERNKFNSDHSLLLGGSVPVFEFDSKPNSDNMAIQLWNLIFGREFRVDSISDIKVVSSKFIDYMNIKCPDGLGMSEKQCIQFVTAQSSSSFLGIQSPSKSKFSLNSMKKTLEAHSNPRLIIKPWLIPNLEFVSKHIHINPSIMDKEYDDICLSAKMSSSSVKGEGSYRDYVFEHDLEEIITILHKGIHYVIYAGTRIDRRGKFRLICAFHAAFRILDFLINNGSYALCEEGGILSQYTTEGFNNAKMWPELVKMSERDNYLMLCIDYKGYDTQISLKEYSQLSKLLNSHRMHDPKFNMMYSLYDKWLRQPKPLVVRNRDSYEVLMPYYKTLASGLHGTHSFENLIGISTYLESLNLGIRSKRFWTNGDDQNILVHRDDIPKFITFLEEYYDISWDKSLVGHSLAVWGKLWFSKQFHPAWEIGTFRSIWEKEGGSVDFVEESKLESNYCKVLQTVITLMRLGKDRATIESWMRKLCKQCTPQINPDLIPYSLQNLKNMKSSSSVRNKIPKGLESCKSKLISRNFSISLISIDNFYDMLLSMYRNRELFTLDVSEIKYYPKGTRMRIEMGFDYSTNPSKNIPFLFAKLFSSPNLPPEKRLVQTILQSTKSFDGACSREYQFTDMYSLAECVNSRNRYIWDRMIEN